MAKLLSSTTRSIKILYAAILFNIVLMLIIVVVLKEMVAGNKVFSPTTVHQFIRITAGVLMLLSVLICKKIFTPIQQSGMLQNTLTAPQYLTIMKRILLVMEVVSFIFLMTYFFTGDFYLVVFTAILLGFLLYIAPTTTRLNRIKDV